MFHPEVIARAVRTLAGRLASALPEGLPRRSLDECWTRRDELASAVDAKGKRRRGLTQAEQTFVTSEQLRCACDYPYWLERYAIIAKESQEAAPLTPLWASQRLFLDKVAELEYQRQQGGHPDGVLVNVLKGRQLGLSTLIETIVAHRATTQPDVRCLVAADVQEQSTYLFGIAEQVIERLPWWLRPTHRSHERGTFWEGETGATIRTAWGKSSRGGLQGDAKTKGNLGRGKTFGVVHLSEFSTWERPEQIRDGLLPGLPIRPRTFVAFESTAKGRYDAWHEQWNQAARGLGRFVNVFIPWYIEPDKYWLPPPVGWVPAASTLAHADLVARTSASYLGRTVTLPREQLYWYEQTRATFEAEGRLYQFREEYPATDLEAFQFAGRPIFPPAVFERLQTQERRPLTILAIEPAKDIAKLKAWEAQRAREQAAAAPAEMDAVEPHPEAEPSPDETPVEA